MTRGQRVFVLRESLREQRELRAAERLALTKMTAKHDQALAERDAAIVSQSDLRRSIGAIVDEAMRRLGVTPTGEFADRLAHDVEYVVDRLTKERDAAVKRAEEAEEAAKKQRQSAEMAKFRADYTDDERDELAAELTSERALADRLAEGAVAHDGKGICCRGCRRYLQHVIGLTPHGHAPDCPVAEHAAKRAKETP